MCKRIRLKYVIMLDLTDIHLYKKKILLGAYNSMSLFAVHTILLQLSSFLMFPTLNFIYFDNIYIIHNKMFVITIFVVNINIYLHKIK